MSARSSPARSSAESRGVRTLYVGHSCAQLSAGLLFLAVPLLALDLARSPALLAGAGAAYAGAGILLSPIAGSVADSTSRRALLSTATLVRAVLAASLPLVLVLGHRPAGAALFIAGAFLLGGAASFYLSTVHSLLPALVGDGDLQSANAVMFVITNGSIFVAPALAGLLSSVVGIAWTFELSAVMGVPAAVAFAALHTPEARAVTGPSYPSLAGRTWEGFAFTWRSRLLRHLLVLWFVAFVGAGSLIELLVYRVNGELRASAGAVGLVVAGAASGGLIGPALVRGLSSRRRRQPEGRRLGRGIVLAVAPVLGCLYLGMATLDGPVPLALLGAAAQAIIAIGVVRSITLAQQATPNVLLGRVTSAALLVEQTAVMAALGLMGWLAALRGASFAFAVLGAELIILGGAAGLTMVRGA